MSYKDYSKLNLLPQGHATDNLINGCLALEGGAFRGVYSQGIMDYWMQHDVNFQCVIGVSAGAMGGAGYVSGQIGRSARVNLGHRHNSNYVGIKAFLKSKSIIRLDFALRDYNAIEPLDTKTFYESGRRFVAVVTNCNTGKTEYLEQTNCSDVIEAVKASASMPFVSPMVYVDGIPYLDGGCSCKVPYEWAIKEGYEKIVVVRTRSREYRKPAGNLNKGIKIYKKHPEFARVYDNSNDDYNRQCDELIKLEESGRVFVIAPTEPVTVSRLEGDVEKLGELYWLGYKDAERTYKDLMKYLQN